MARVLGAHGVRGDLRIEVLSDNPHRFDVGKRLYLDGAPYVIVGSRLAGRTALLKLEGIDSREQAQALLGKAFQVPLSEIPAPKRGLYHYQLLGLKVVTTDGRELGTLVEVAATGSNDVYLVRGPQGELFIPATKDVIAKIDVDAGVMTVNALPGLLP